MRTDPWGHAQFTADTKPQHLVNNPEKTPYLPMTWGFGSPMGERLFANTFLPQLLHGHSRLSQKQS